MDNTSVTALVIFIITYTGIIFTRLPKMNIDRPSAAFFGAIAMIVFGVVSLEEAVRAVDYNTIALLLGMMIIVSTLELDGFFSFIAIKTMSFAKTSAKLLVVITFITGIASAFLVNDAVVLLFTPIIITICRKAGLPVIPFLIAEILASNIGSAMTVTGNPQNMLIGISSGIPYTEFIFRLLPVSLTGMVIIILIVRLFYRKTLKNHKFLEYDNPVQHTFGVEPGDVPQEYNIKSMITSVPVFITVIVSFFLHHMLNLSIPIIALVGAALILIFGKVRPSKVIRQVDWVLLVFFSGLFIVVHGIEKAGLLNNLIGFVSIQENMAGLGGIHLLSLMMSQIVSNVPFTVLMLPFMKSASSDVLWLALASASTLAGNATLVGAMANLIVVESAEQRGVKIRFMEFFKIGIVVTVLTLLTSFLYLLLLL